MKNRNKALLYVLALWAYTCLALIIPNWFGFAEPARIVIMSSVVPALFGTNFMIYRYETDSDTLRGYFWPWFLAYYAGAQVIWTGMLYSGFQEQYLLASVLFGLYMAYFFVVALIRSWIHPKEYEETDEDEPADIW